MTVVVGVETAGQAGAELVVLATRGGLTMLPGPVSQYVLQNAPCPVLVVPENGRAKPSS
jgi:nucleotide-binding universal stress UspA family protein